MYCNVIGIIHYTTSKHSAMPVAATPMGAPKQSRSNRLNIQTFFDDPVAGHVIK